MTNADLILAAIRARPGSTDAELRQSTGVEPHQQVNQICRRLEAQGVVVRRSRPDGRIGNYVPGSQELKVVPSAVDATKAYEVLAVEFPAPAARRARSLADLGGEGQLLKLVDFSGGVQHVGKTLRDSGCEVRPAPAENDPMEILPPKCSDVLGSVWLATALLTYDAARSRSSPPGVAEVCFRQSDILRLASRLCSKEVHSARVQQWANGDHPSSSRNYLRAVGAARRLSSVDDFEGERTLPRDLFSAQEPVAAWSAPTERLLFGGLVSWVTDIYSEWTLAFPSDEQSSPQRRPSPIVPVASASLRASAPKVPFATHVTPTAGGFALQSSWGPVDFANAPLRFSNEPPFSDVFARLRTTTSVSSVLQNPRYRAGAEEIRRRFPDRLQMPLGQFLAERKSAGDPLYLKFLNAHGDKCYRRFELCAPEIESRRGVYAFTSGGALKYIGRSRDPFGQRVDRGYGYIAPRACFSDGQSTNCKVNAFVTAAWPDIAYFVHIEDDEKTLMRLEGDLIARYAPPWNGRVVR